MSCTEPGSTSEVHSGNPSGAKTAWTFPPWQCALPEYHRSMTSPLALTARSRHRSDSMTVPSRVKCGNRVVVGPLQRLAQIRGLPGQHVDDLIDVSVGG